MLHDHPGGREPRRGWLNRLLSSGGDEEEQRLPIEPAWPTPVTFDLTEDREGESVPAELTALAEQLAQLIASAQDKLNGAATLVQRSADDAAAYGNALAADAAAIDRADLPHDLATGLLDLTRAMIERTNACEARLRSTNSELRGLRRDLDEAQEQAERDPLTGLPNRRGIEQALRCAVATAEAANSALAVAYCDMDTFKQLNEAHGYALGDRVLRLVADQLVDGCGEGTVVGRQGSESFVMLFDGVPVAEAAGRIDAVREGLAARALRSRSDGRPIGTITFSAGVAGLRAGESAEGVLERADKALLRARRMGGNRVLADEEGDDTDAL